MSPLQPKNAYWAHSFYFAQDYTGMNSLKRPRCQTPPRVVYSLLRGRFRVARRNLSVEPLVQSGRITNSDHPQCLCHLRDCIDISPKDIFKFLPRCDLLQIFGQIGKELPTKVRTIEKKISLPREHADEEGRIGLT